MNSKLTNLLAEFNKTYCMNIVHGCQACRYNNKYLVIVITAWRKAIHRAWKIPYITHTNPIH